MAMSSYIATVQPGSVLQLPDEARSLGLQPGDQVRVSLERVEVPEPGPNAGMRDALARIEERQRSRPYAKGVDTLLLLREARDGAMYGDE